VTDPLLELHSLAHAAGVHTAYRDSRGRLRVASPEALLAVLRALGISIDRVGQAHEMRRTMDADRPSIEPIVVAWNGRSGPLRINAMGSVRAALLTDTGETLPVRIGATPVRMGTRVHITDALPYGVHTLHLEISGSSHETCVICAPQLAVAMPEPRAWGAFMPLQAFGNSRAGPGTYAELADAARRLASLGASYVGTLPLLASFLDTPFQPSPYAPASRLFWNDVFLVNGADTDSGPETERARLLDYAAAAAAQRPYLQAAADAFFAEGGATDARFGSFLESHPRAHDYALFRAACDRFRGGFETWPAAARQGGLTADDVDPADVRRHLFAAWRADESLAELARMSDDGTAAKLYIDLPLGVDNSGYDIWREHALFADGVAAGAPPDALFRGGQNWGFRPLIPAALRKSRYAYLFEVLQHHMRHAGALRIDHVMSLVRLYWIPSGFPATEGVYVRYPRDELLALLTLLSQRHETVLIGEDLGTVPDEVRAAMEQHGLLRMQVLQFELGGTTLPRSRRAVAASFGTHDTPTLAGFWRGLDIDDQLQLGLLDESGAVAARATRARLRRRVCRALALDPETAEESDILRGLMHHIAAGRARLVLVALEDLWLEPLQQNVPGTRAERPNWQRRARFGINEALERPDVIALLQEVDRLRKREMRNAE
jgi:4-alpha-glucanotransferase